MGKTQFKEILGGLVVKPQGHPTLVPVSDKRPTITVTGVEHDFTEITEDMQPNPREDIAWDVSHFRRLAFFLNSYESAQETDEEKD